jgi:hypothetical protein
MTFPKAHQQPPLVAYYNRREFVPTNHSREYPVPTIYDSAYHRTAPSQQQKQFQREQPAVWYQKNTKANKNDVVREYTQPVRLDPIPHSVAAPLMREELYAQVSSVATASNTTETKQSRPVSHFDLASWPMLMRHSKNTVVTTFSQQQQPQEQHFHHHFIHWPHWSHMDQFSSVRNPHVSHHQWSWRRAHSVGAEAA